MNKILPFILALAISSPALAMGSTNRGYQPRPVSTTERAVAASIYRDTLARVKDNATFEELSQPDVVAAVQAMRAAYERTKTETDRAAFNGARADISREGFNACTLIAGC